MKLGKLFRRIFKWGSIGVLFLFVAGIIYTIVRGPLMPCFLDDGPFYGARLAKISDTAPSEELKIFNGMLVQVFQPTEKNKSPVVVLRDKDQQILWSVQADGLQPGDVAEIHLNKFDSPALWYGVVHGRVHWAFGKERAYWYISRFGRLGGYCYSW